MEVLLMLIMAASNILCFLIGARVGQKVVKGEEVLPPVNPEKLVQERRERREAEFQKSVHDTILWNIDNYDGTGAGQKDIPRGV